jgi:hypothetical protein
MARDARHPKEPDMTIALQNTTAASLGVQQLASAFSPAFSHLRILRNLIIPMPEGSVVRTAKIDAVLVCETGVYLFEIKAWRNAFVYRKKLDEAPPRWFLRLQGCTRAREVKDPAWQGGRKTTQLRSLLSDDLRLQYFVLLPCEGVELEGVMPAAVITQQDLPYIARLVRNNGRTARTYPLLDAAAINRTAQRLLDIQGSLSIEDHMQNCRERSEQISMRWSAGHPATAILPGGIGLQ